MHSCNNKYKILVTGTAGFIGFHLAKSLLERGDEVVGVDIINDYYDTNLKFDRLTQTGIDRNEIEWGKLVQSKKYEKYRFIRMSIADKEQIFTLFESEKFDSVVNLAAQAGVRYSIENPMAYIESNIVGFAHILEGCRHNNIGHLVYASSSSVYGANTTMPFSVHQNVDHPLSLYAASKKSNELMAHTYSHLYNLPTTGLRFFTVYGPWGRPDMALFKFTKAILAGEPIEVFNHGKHRRDFTYIDDIVEGIIRVLDCPATSNTEWNSYKPDPGTSKAPWCVLNIGNSQPIELLDYIGALEKAIGKKAEMEFLPLQAGDVRDTYANVDDLVKKFHYKPTATVENGIARFVTWYYNYFKV